MPNEPESKKKKFAETVALIGGILGIITATITVAQYVTGKPSLVSFFAPSPSTAVVSQATPTFTPSLFLTTTSTPTPISPQKAPAHPSFIPIQYDSFWTWFWWATTGIIVGLGTFVGTGIKSENFDVYWWVLIIYGFTGGGISTVLSFISSFLVNHLQLPYDFPISISVGGVITLILGAIIISLAE